MPTEPNWDLIAGWMSRRQRYAGRHRPKAELAKPNIRHGTPLLIGVMLVLFGIIAFLTMTVGRS